MRKFVLLLACVTSIAQAKRLETPAEAAKLLRTPDAAATFAFIDTLDAASDRIAVQDFGTTPEGRALIRAETRTYVRREGTQEVVYRVSLDSKLVRVLWGPRNQEARQQRTWFDSDSQARDAYFARLDGLTADGFIDADSQLA